MSSSRAGSKILIRCNILPLHHKKNIYGVLAQARKLLRDWIKLILIQTRLAFPKIYLGKETIFGQYIIFKKASHRFVIFLISLVLSATEGRALTALHF